MNKHIFFLILAVLAICGASEANACTNFLVGKRASTDGSTFISYNADSYGMFGRLIYLPHAKHAKGTMRQIYDGDTNEYHGQIEEAPETYAVMGYINEFQLSIMETTFGGREELADKNGILDYVSLMRIALQRAKTCREAIKLMGDLVDKYGYVSEGESFSLADKDELWIMEMIGKGTGETGANWVAVRIPDDCIACHANHSRIHNFSQYDKNDVMHSKGIVDFARKKGFYSGSDADFDFSAAFAPADFSAIRYCETRVWSFYNRFVDGMDKYLDYADGRHIDTAEPFPLYMKPKRKLSRQDIFDAMRDHYEGTPFSTLKDCGMGPGEMPYRPTPLSFKYEGKSYFNERPISTQQTADTYVAQIRGDLPDAIGGILWYGQDDPNMIAYVPIYCQNKRVPINFNCPEADAKHFSWNSSFWVCNWVSNMVYPRYSTIFPALQAVRDSLESQYSRDQAGIESEALALYKQDPEKGRLFVENYSDRLAADMHRAWRQLGENIIVNFNDMMANGKRVGYPDSYRKKIVEETGDYYLVPDEKK